MISRDQYSLLLLAGGKSRRMGQNKAELLLEGRPFWLHMLEKGRALGLGTCCLSGYRATAPDVRTVEDIYPDRGPLGGLHACMAAMDTPYCLVLPVDMPTLPIALLRELLDAHGESAEPQKVLLWEHGGKAEPLVGIYPRAMAGAIRELIAPGPAPVFRVLDRWGYVTCPLLPPGEEPPNVNTPGEYQQLRRKFDG